MVLGAGESRSARERNPHNIVLSHSKGVGTMKRLLAAGMALGLVCLLASEAMTETKGAADLTLTQLVEGFKETTVASVSDAIDQVTGQRGFMYHDMRPLFKAKVVGPAVTTLIRPSIKATGSPGPNHSLMAIDEADRGSVVVIVVEALRPPPQWDAMSALVRTCRFSALVSP
jgi:hypothetical protein